MPLHGERSPHCDLCNCNRGNCYLGSTNFRVALPGRNGVLAFAHAIQLRQRRNLMVEVGLHLVA